jgi:hypothetical protein
LSSATFNNNAAMTTAPDISGTSLSYVYVTNCGALTSPPDFTGLTGLQLVQIAGNDAMTTAPDFTGLTALETAQIYDNSVMTSAPDFTGCTALVSVNVSNNVAMASAPDFTDCSALSNVTVADCAITDTNLLTMCAQIYYAGASPGGTLDMQGGTNGSFDGQNLPTEITDLQGAGWTVNFNDNNPP